jgi:hypothetical protein
VFKNVALYSALPKWLWNDLEREHNKMSDSIHNVGFFAAIGILLATLIIGSIAVAGFKIPSLRLPGFLANRGTLTIKVMDAPTELEHLNITIDELSIQKANETDEAWIDLELIDGEPIYFDLLALHDVSLTLSRTEIEAGNYTMIRMHILTANATYIGGSTDELRVPSSYIKVLLKPHLIMQSDAAITITIDLEPVTNISHSLNLRPTMKAMVSD